MMSLRKRFPGFDISLIEESFSLEQVSNHAALLEWLDTPSEIRPDERIALKQIQERLLENINYWNEFELKVHCITRLIDLVGYEHPPEYRYFLERAISAQVNDIEISCIPDLVIAAGKGVPRQPYFCLHEYKKQRTETDPLGQLMLQLLTAQALNENLKQPVYGCYVLGRIWFFVVLVGRQYSVSLAYDATKDEIFDIFIVLKALKPRIEAILQNISA